MLILPQKTASFERVMQKLASSEIIYLKIVGYKMAVAKNCEYNPDDVG